MEILDNIGDLNLGEKQSYDRLVDGTDIRYKTEITDEQRSIISCIETSIMHFGNKGIKLHVATKFVLSYIEMGASIDRKSRGELVESLKAKLDFLEKEQIMNKQSNQIR